MGCEVSPEASPAHKPEGPCVNPSTSLLQPWPLCLPEVRGSQLASTGNDAHPSCWQPITGPPRAGPQAQCGPYPAGPPRDFRV